MLLDAAIPLYFKAIVLIAPYGMFAEIPLTVNFPALVGGTPFCDNAPSDKVARRRVGQQIKRIVEPHGRRRRVTVQAVRHYHDHSGSSNDHHVGLDKAVTQIDTHYH
jgi:hypothetical protein